MWAVATDFAMRPAKTEEPIVSRFWGETAVGKRNHALDGSGSRSPTRNNTLEGDLPASYKQYGLYKSGFAAAMGRFTKLRCTLAFNFNVFNVIIYTYITGQFGTTP